MELQRTTYVNTEDDDAWDEDGNEYYKEISNKVANGGTLLFVIYIKCLW